MVTKALPLAMATLAVTLLVSGCLSATTQGPADGQETQVYEGQSTGQQEAEVLGQLGSELIGENDTVEIGEMI